MLDSCAPLSRWIDVFCERGAFDEQASRRILAAGRERGLLLRVHGNQLGEGPGVRLAVVSNKGDFAVQELIARQFPGAFDAVLGENEAAGIRKKPAPDMVEAALERMGATRDSLVYIGDSEVDVQTAANVGCPCVSCTWGFRSVDELLAAGATTFVDTPDELERVLLGTAR